MIESSTVSDLSTFLERHDSGGFTLRGGSGDSVRVAARSDGWVVSGAAPVDGARMTRAASGGFVLRDAGGAELGWTSRLIAEEAGTGSVLLDDGRLFRIAGRGPSERGLDLCGWETPGAYLTARPEGQGWRIATTAAGSLLPPSQALPILFAAELLDAERPA